MNSSPPRARARNYLEQQITTKRLKIKRARRARVCVTSELISVLSLVVFTWPGKFFVFFPVFQIDRLRRHCDCATGAMIDQLPVYLNADPN